MFPDGICRVTDSYYTKTVQFQDINYQLNQNEDKTAIFDGWCDFLNYFDSSVRFQLSFVNMSANKDNYARYITISPQGDDFDSIRLEYTQMLQNQLARGNNGLIKTKYLTFGVEADGLKAAKPRLERIETDILNNFKRLGVAAEPMNGTERLRLLHGMLHMDEQEPFRFSWDWLAPSGLSVKDFIAPSSFEFRTGRSFGVGRRIGCASFMQILAPELNDRMLADFLDTESSLIVSMHVQSVDQVKAIKTIKRKITDLQKMTIEEQKRLVAYLLHPTDSCKFGLLLALYTGLRIGELCALRWSCIDLREQTIRIAATMQRLGGTGEGTRIVIGAPKSDSSLRTIPLPAQIAVLCRHMQPVDPEAYVLTGGPAYMEPRTLQYRLKRYTAACGLEGVHAHTLRHTFATRAIESGFELKSLSEVLGHATTAITMERYVHSTLEMKRTNMNKLAMPEI